MTVDAPLESAPAIAARRASPPPRVRRLLDTSSATGLAWIAIIVGGFLTWVPPSAVNDKRVDLVLAPLVAALLHILVRRWSTPRAAWTAVGVYSLLLGLFEVAPGLLEMRLIERNLTCAGAPQMLVGLGCLCLLEGLVLPLWAWSLLVIGASRMQPQVAFVPLLMMTLLRSRTVLVMGFIDKARAAALRCVALCLLLVIVKRAGGFDLPIRVDSVTLPLAWWTATWLLEGEALMPYAARVLISIILGISTVQGFRAWPALGLVLLCGFVAGAHGPRPEAAPPAYKPSDTSA